MNASNYPSFLETVNDCILYPRITASIRTGSRTNGALSGEKSVTLAYSVSLAKALLLTAAFLLTLRAAVLMMRMKWERKIKRKYKSKMKKRRQK